MSNNIYLLGNDINDDMESKSAKELLKINSTSSSCTNSRVTVCNIMKMINSKFFF